MLFNLLFKARRLIVIRLLFQLAEPVLRPYKHDLAVLIAGLVLMFVGPPAALIAGLITGGPGAIPGLAAVLVGLALTIMALRSGLRHARGHLGQLRAVRVRSD